MSYGIMRIEKRKRSAVYGLQIEANRTIDDHEKGREFDKSDVDWDKTKLNIHIKKTDNWNQAITKRLHKDGLQERKDSIVMIDAFYGISPEWEKNCKKEEMIAYFFDCLAFHIQEYCQGDESRVINAVIHMDEKTPHLHIASIPVLENETGMHLSAKLVMGNRTDYRLRQDRFYEQVSKARGFDRGEVREPAEVKKHTTKREWQIANQEKELVENDKAIKKQKEVILHENEKLLSLEQIQSISVEKPLIGRNIKIDYEELGKLKTTALFSEEALKIIATKDRIIADAREMANKILRQAADYANKIIGEAQEKIKAIESKLNSRDEIIASRQLRQIMMDYPQYFNNKGIYRPKKTREIKTQRETVRDRSDD